MEVFPFVEMVEKHSGVPINLQYFKSCSMNALMDLSS